MIIVILVGIYTPVIDYTSI